MFQVGLSHTHRKMVISRKFRACKHDSVSFFVQFCKRKDIFVMMNHGFSIFDTANCGWCCGILPFLMQKSLLGMVLAGGGGCTFV